MLLARSWAGGGQCSFVPQPCYDPMTMMLVSAGATAAGTGISAMGTISGGSQKQQSANMQAGQLNEQAELTRWRADRIREQAASLAEGERAAGKQELAEAGVQRDEYKRQKDLALSALQARAGAGGFMATDPTAMAIADDIVKRGTLQERRAVAGGLSARAGRYAKSRAIQTEGDMNAYMQDEDARRLDRQADMTRWEGKVAKKASNIQALTTILGGVSSIAGKFNPTAAEPTSPFRYGKGVIEDTFNPRTGWRTTTRQF
jgi:hypothetical protein